jgi:deoxyribodipyrimidine photo-lyase
MAAIVWFKNDLRVRDNAALYEAIQCHEPVIPLYCLSPDQFELTSFGLRKTGVFRAKFLLESLRDLDTQLRGMGSGLLVRQGLPAEVLEEVAKEYGATKVYSSSEIGFEEIEQMTLVSEHLKVLNIEVIATENNALLNLEDYALPIHQVPDVFTDFRHLVEKNWAVRAECPMPEQLLGIDFPELELPELSDLGFDKVESDKRSVLEFRGGESEGVKRFTYYFEETKLVSSYKLTRNGMVGGDYSSKFSPWLAMGCISARTIYHELIAYERKYGSNESTYWLVFELLWREYFQLMMRKYPSQFFLKKGLNRFLMSLPAHNKKVFENWMNSETDNAFINANMRELKHTGFMSNRGRQNVASFLCHHLQSDWQYGAAYFEEMLIDYDVSSNWCNWAYLAGVGNDPIKNRVFNPDKQAQQYDGDRRYRNLWL